MTDRLVSPLSPLKKALLLAALGLALASPVAPAPANPPGELGSQIAAFAQSFADGFWNDDPICVRVDGADAKKAAYVQTRVEATIRAAGVSVQRACNFFDARVEIRFAADAERTAQGVLRDHGYPIWPFPLVTPTGADRPIKAWYGLVWDYAGSARWGGERAGANGHNLGSYPGAGRKLALAVVVIDPQRTQDKSLDAIADYATLLAIVRPQTLDSCNVLPSVTDLYAGACPGRAEPPGLTAADTAYLKALYAGNPDLRATRSESELTGRMAKLLGGATVASR